MSSPATKDDVANLSEALKRLDEALKSLQRAVDAHTHPQPPDDFDFGRSDDH